MHGDWLIECSVVGNEEGPASSITVVLVATMKYIRVEEKSITRLHLNMDQRKNLHIKAICFINNIPCYKSERHTMS